MEFKIKEPPINIGADISVKSFEIIQDELKNYSKINNFSLEQQAVIERLIHTTACFDEVLNSIYFTQNAIDKTKELLIAGAKIIVDVNMIKSGLSEFYLNTYKNEVICYINEDFVFKSAELNGTTRSYAAVVEAIKQHKDKPLILVCGNAPTFIYAAIKTLLEQNVDLSKVMLLLFPVGFVNVVESKEYAKDFCNAFNVDAIIMQGRFGSSTMGVATLHAIYKLIEDFDKQEKYNGK